MNTANSQHTGKDDTDTEMGAGSTHPTQRVQANNSTTQQANDTASASQSSLGTNHYEHYPANEYQYVTWFTNALNTLDDRWNERWGIVADKLTRQENQTNLALTELATIKAEQQQEVIRAKKEADA